MIRRLIALVGLAGVTIGFAEAIHFWMRFTREVCGKLEDLSAGDCFGRQEPKMMILSVFFGGAALLLLITVLIPFGRSAK
jgi:hypothetical protein